MKPRSHFRKPIASVCHVTPLCEHALFLHECFFDFVFLLSAMDGKIEQRVYIPAFGEHSLSQTAVFEWHSHFRAGRVSVEDDEHSR
jgi:hypothetical protein